MVQRYKMNRVLATQAVLVSRVNSLLVSVFSWHLLTRTRLTVYSHTRGTVKLQSGALG